MLHATSDDERRPSRLTLFAGALSIAGTMFAFALIPGQETSGGALAAPGVYWQEDACTRIPRSGRGLTHLEPFVEWCVPAVEVATDGRLEVQVVWRLGESLDTVEWGPDDGNRNLYLVDSSGRRYDHVATLRGAAFGGQLYAADPSLDGVFVFPPPANPRAALAFRDDDNGQRIDGLRLDPSRLTTPERSRSVLGDLTRAERVDIVREWSGLGPYFKEEITLFRTEHAFWGRLVRPSDSASRGAAGRENPEVMRNVDASIGSVEKLLAELMRAPLLAGEYMPTSTHTDDDPHRSIALQVGGTTVEFFTRSQGEWNVPWAVEVQGATWVVPGELVARALQDFLGTVDPERASRPGPGPGWRRAAPGVDLGPETELRLAVQRGDLGALERLLEGGADPDQRFVWDGETPLTVAALNRRPGIVEYLLARGASVDAITPRLSALRAAVWQDDLETVRMLLEAGADPSPEDRAWDALELASSLGHQRIVALLAQTVESGIRDPENLALVYASQAGKAPVVRTLLAAGADPNARGAHRGEKPLLVAASNGHIEAVRALLEGGADVDAESRNGATALGVAVLGSYTDVIELLLSAGADVRHEYRERAYLMCARTGEVVRLLVEAGADVNARDKKGKTVLMHVASPSCGGPSHPGLRFRPSPPPDQLGAVAQLLEYDVEVDARDREGHTAMDLAAGKGFSDVAQLLREAAEDP
jgi:ankyrin repeat protein